MLKELTSTEVELVSYAFTGTTLSNIIALPPSSLSKVVLVTFQLVKTIKQRAAPRTTIRDLGDWDYNRLF